MNKAIMFVTILALLATTAIAGEFFLKQTLYEGESRQYTVGNKVYTVELTGVFDRQLKAQFKVNGEETKALGEGESDKLSDGSVIQARDVLPQESGDGKDLVQFNFFPGAGNMTAQTAVQPTPTTTAKAPTATTPNATTEQAPSEQPAAQQPTEPTQKKAATVDMTKVLQKKSVWGRISDWFKRLFD
ncbi:hypothetical protein HZB90_00290 [archaeon]|nr:hypothetical protein [archaeon]